MFSPQAVADAIIGGSLSGVAGVLASLPSAAFQETEGLLAPAGDALCGIEVLKSRWRELSAAAQSASERGDIPALRDAWMRAHVFLRRLREAPSPLEGRSDLVVLHNRVLEAGRVVFLTGAGLSAPSGVPTFRGEGGLWEGYDPKRVADPIAFNEDPALVWRFYDARRKGIAPCFPNPAHYALRIFFGLRDHIFSLTQNVDGLLAAAGVGSIELHGNLWRIWCVDCDRIAEDRRVPLPEIPPKCPDCGAVMRPDVVWYGEGYEPKTRREMRTVVGALGLGDVLILAGTSCMTWGMKNLVNEVKRAGALIAEINLEKTWATLKADFVLRGDVSEILPRLLDGP